MNSKKGSREDMFKKTMIGLGIAATCAACQPASSATGTLPEEKAPVSDRQATALDKVVAPPASATPDEEALYYLGYSMGMNIRQFDLTEAEKNSFKDGFLNSLVPGAGEPEMQVIGPKIQAFAKKRNDQLVEKNKKLGAEYLDKRAAESGVEKAPQGFLYKSIKEGEGAQPVLSDRVKVHYTGTLIDGTKFDSSYDRKGPDGTAEPALFPLRGVIQCWTEGLQKMKVGGKAQFVCPAELAYGSRPRPKIPGGSTLIFDVELLEIMPPPPPKPTASEPRPATPTGPGGMPQNPPGEPQWRK